MITLAGTAVDAVSVAGLETSICLPGLGCALDMGVCRPTAVQRGTVLFTHAHIDHLGALAQHCATRALLGMAPPVYAVPEENLAGVEALLDAWRRLDRSELACTLVPARPGTEVRLRRNTVARAFRSIHRVPCLGWGIWETRTKLRAAFVGRPGTEIAAARAAGEPVTEATTVPIVAFTGDSRVDVIDREDVLRQARLLIMEVTFLDDAVSVERSREMGHIHLDEVIERADIFENEAILMTHNSARYSPETAKDIVMKRIPDVLRGRVHVLPNTRAFRPSAPPTAAAKQ